jgi:hypothetical protein
MAKSSKKIRSCINLLNKMQKGEHYNGGVLLKKLVGCLSELRSISECNNESSPTLVDASRGFKTNLAKDCSVLLNTVFKNLSPPFSANLLELYLKESNSFITSPSLPLVSKVALVDAEGQYLFETIRNNCSDSEIWVDSMKFRIEFGIFALNDKNNPILSDEKSITNRIAEYLGHYNTWNIHQGQFLQAYEYMHSGLSKTNSYLLQSILVSRLISFSLAYNLASVYEMKELLEQYVHAFDKQDLDFEYSRLENSLISTSGGFSYFQGTLNEQTVQDKADVATLISFSIPHHIKVNVKNNHVLRELDNDINLYAIPVNAFWRDPIFRAYSDLELMNINWRYYCDIEPLNETGYTHIIITIDKVFMPDLKIHSEGYDRLSFEEEKALTGREHYPHKSYAIELLRNNLNVIQEIIDIDKEVINVDLFSNFTIQIIETSTNECFFRQLYALTNPHSYEAVKASFHEHLVTSNLEDAYQPIVDLFKNTEIVSGRNLQDFVVKTIDILVKDSVEQRGGYQYLWLGNLSKDSKPRSEIQLQPYIYDRLKTFYELMGIEISREKISANGSVDFFVTYTSKRNELLKVSIELKLAHSNSIVDGLNKQLPAYMRSERTKYGIYLVFWFKGANFDKPYNYDSANELKLELERLNHDRKVKISIVSCDKPTSPSKL